MTLHIRHCSVYISPLFMGMITLMLLIDRTGIMNLLLAAMLLHEAGHLLFMGLFDCLPNKIILLPFEINIVASKTPSFLWQEWLISGAGIFANGIAFLLFNGDFAKVNLFVAIFNSLPIVSMDGFQMLSLLLDSLRYGKEVLWIISAITIIGVAAAGGWMLWRFHNPLLLLFGIYMGLFSIRCRKNNPIVEK